MVSEMTHLQDVHYKVEKEQKARGKNKPVQQQTFDYTKPICGGNPYFHQLVKQVAHRSCNKQPETHNKGKYE